MGFVWAAVILGIVFLVIGLAVKALKWLIIVAVVLWVAGLVRGFMARRQV